MTKSNRKRMKKLKAPWHEGWTHFKEVGNTRAIESHEHEEGPKRWVGSFVNSLYQVEVYEYDTNFGTCLWLAIVRRDRSAVHDWRHLQRIKNELAGPEREAMEIYPAESRLVDTNNQFHLFVLPEDSHVPFGYTERDVSDSSRLEGTAHKQRRFDIRPPDCNARPADQITMGIFGRHPEVEDPDR